MAHNNPDPKLQHILSEREHAHKVSTEKMLADRKASVSVRATKDIWNFNNLRVEVGTTGPCGGDMGSGGITFIQFEDIAGTAMTVEVNGQLIGHDVCDVSKVTLCFLGDSEMSTFREALRFALGVLDLDPKGKAE
jgi:hypothetical protein